ncbi:membrane-spanning 4-domains subfamily A member 4A-like [Takifugu rubripes]|uniref:Membrane-spanning 4-domains subfamily A member 4A-like n=1 Tax=Takifugu rubripes TaxID=31033 RepID=A0A674MP07_TAKRU|nr:membrane-spanning 4-domains subfamily A member 4A-like [Takifugu rubripes]
MSAPVINEGTMMVVTRVQPVTMPAIAVGNHAFIKGYPLALGATQIMIGVVILLSGIVMVVSPATIAVYSGIFVWGALLYIVAGSLTVAAGKYDSRCLVNGALAVSIVTTVISLTAAILHGLDTAGILSHCSNYSMCYQYMTLSQGFSGILAVFNLLMLAVSITVAGFACNATCSCCNPPVLTEMVIAEAPKSIDPPPTYS